MLSLVSEYTNNCYKTEAFTPLIHLPCFIKMFNIVLELLKRKKKQISHIAFITLYIQKNKRDPINVYTHFISKFSVQRHSNKYNVSINVYFILLF